MAHNADDRFFDLSDRTAMSATIRTVSATELPVIQALLLVDIRSLLVTLTRETMKQGD